VPQERPGWQGLLGQPPLLAARQLPLTLGRQVLVQALMGALAGAQVQVQAGALPQVLVLAQAPREQARGVWWPLGRQGLEPGPGQAPGLGSPLLPLLAQRVPQAQEQLQASPGRAL
jgi:hypothetical protein